MEVISAVVYKTSEGKGDAGRKRRVEGKGEGGWENGQEGWCEGKMGGSCEWEGERGVDLEGEGRVRGRKRGRERGSRSRGPVGVMGRSGWSVRSEGVEIGRKGVEGVVESSGKREGVYGSMWSVWRERVASGKKGMMGKQNGAKDGAWQGRRYGSLGRDRWT